MSLAIELKNITKIYPFMSAPAVKDISLSIGEHELVALIGASGSGKSTLLNIIGLLDRPTQGQYCFYGESTEMLSNSQLATVRNESIGFVFQSFFLLPHITIEKNIALPLLYRDFPMDEALEKAREMLEKMHLMHLYHRRPNQLSGGEQQRIAIARALVGHPKILLADEPTGALDSRTSEEIMNLFLDLYEHEKKTVIIATHNMDVAQKCHRLIVLKDGQIVKDERKL